jgi:hypothetical protein
VTVTANQFIPCDAASDPTITVEPGGAVYSVCTSLLGATALHLATDPGQHAAAYRAAAGQGTRTFHLNGFPRPPQSWHLGLARMARLPLSAAGGRPRRRPRAAGRSPGRSPS